MAKVYELDQKLMKKLPAEDLHAYVQYHMELKDIEREIEGKIEGMSDLQRTFGNEASIITASSRGFLNTPIDVFQSKIDSLTGIFQKMIELKESYDFLTNQLEQKEKGSEDYLSQLYEEHGVERTVQHHVFVGNFENLGGFTRQAIGRPVPQYHPNEPTNF